MAPDGVGLRSLVTTVGAWGLFFAGSLAMQALYASVHWSTAASRVRLANALGPPAWSFWGVHVALATAACALAFRGTRPIPWLWLRAIVVALQVAVGFVIFAVMMIGYSCSLGDCL
ncbi:MAG: hypothetical protein WCJ30_09135 [Deltaproteobacteria bacterium]